MTFTSLILSLFLPMTTIATRYADTPSDEGGIPACAARVPRALYRAAHGERCAHRSAPCGTRFLITDGARFTTCTVLDRGPYGAQDLAGQYFVAHTDRALSVRKGTYRGDLDLSPNVARALGMHARVKDGKVQYTRGRVPILYWTIPPIQIKTVPVPRV